MHQHDKDGERRGVGKSDSGGCFDEHGSSLLIQGRRNVRGLHGAQLSGPRNIIQLTIFYITYNY